MTSIGGGFVGLFDMPDPDQHETKCHVCHRTAPLTKEHVPPRAAFNNESRIWERLNPWSARQRASSRPEWRTQVLRETWQNGFYVESLCAGCNSSMGGDVVKAYARHARNLAEAPRLFEPRGGKRMVRVHEDTLLLARQIATMILAIERTEFGDLHSDLRAFARGDLKSVLPPFRVLAFLVPQRPDAGTISRAQYRGNGLSSGYAALAGEISMFPFGIVYAFELAHRYRPLDLADITHWFSASAPVDRLNAWIETSSRLTVLNSVYCALGNARYYPQIDTVLPRG